MDATRTTRLINIAADAKTRLDTLKPMTKAKLDDKQQPEFIAEAFELLAFADLNAVALEQAHPDLAFGFAQHDARFMRSLRDQTLGVGQAPRPLTKAQLSNVRTIMLRDQYTTQLALLLWPIPY